MGRHESNKSSPGRQKERRKIKLARNKSRGIPSTAKIMSWGRSQPDNPDDIEDAKQEMAYMSTDQPTTDYNVYAFNAANEGDLTKKMAMADARSDYYENQMNPMHSTARIRRQLRQKYNDARGEGARTFRRLSTRYEASPLHDRGTTYDYGDGIYNSDLGTNAQSTFSHQLFKNTYDLKHGDGAAYNKGADFFFDYDKEGNPTQMNVNGAEDILERRKKMRGIQDMDDMFEGRTDDYGTPEFSDTEDDTGFVDPDEEYAQSKKGVKKHDKVGAKNNKVR